MTSDLKKRNAIEDIDLEKKRIMISLRGRFCFGSEELQERLLHTIPHQMNNAKAY